jgi:tripartite-type tricarboxylate transporter receptor subunit TctC
VKNIVRGVSAALAAALLSSLIAAQAASPGAGQYPDKPIRVILSVPAGGTPDVVARMVTPGLSSLLGQQLVVDNRGGAGGMIGAEIVAKAAPDGYTLFVSSPGALTILPHLRKQVPYDTLRDFAPISLIALAKAEPGKLNYASAGNGTANHLAMELFKSMAGVNITHVPYKGAPQAVTDVLGGHMNMMFNSIAPVLQHIKAGRVRLLGVASARRSPQLPDTPTISEAGVPGFEAVNWFGLFAPAGTPKSIIARLNDALVKVVRAPELRAQFETQGSDPVGSSPEEFAAFIRRDMAKYAQVVKVSGAKVD